MHEQFEDILSAIDGKIADLSPQALQQELQSVPLEVLGRIQIDRPAQFPNLMSWLPSMPSKETQRTWTGEAGHAADLRFCGHRRRRSIRIRISGNLVDDLYASPVARRA